MEEKNYKDALTYALNKIENLEKENENLKKKLIDRTQECIGTLKELNDCKQELIDCMQERNERTKELIERTKELINRNNENAELKKQLAAKNPEQHIGSGRQFKNFCWTQSVYDIKPTREDLMELKSISKSHKDFIALIKQNYKCDRSTAYRWLKKFNIPSDRRRRGE